MSNDSCVNIDFHVAEPKKDKQLPTHPEIGKLLDHLKAKTRALPHILRDAMSKNQRIRLPKPRQGSPILMEHAFQAAKSDPHLLGGTNDADQLLSDLRYLDSLRQLELSLRGHLNLVADSARKLHTDLWLETMRIYGIARHLRKSVTAVALVMDLQEELAHGPRMQTSITKPLAEPIPTSKRALNKALTEKAQAEAAKKSGPEEKS